MEKTLECFCFGDVALTVCKTNFGDGLTKLLQRWLEVHGIAW